MSFDFRAIRSILSGNHKAPKLRCRNGAPDRALSQHPASNHILITVHDSGVPGEWSQDARDEVSCVEQKSQLKLQAILRCAFRSHIFPSARIGPPDQRFKWHSLKWVSHGWLPAPGRINSRSTNVGRRRAAMCCRGWIVALLLLIASPASAKPPYPIILVHGINGSGCRSSASVRHKVAPANRHFPSPSLAG